jgi:poly(3-hydroxybutyrate) depolymerase
MRKDYWLAIGLALLMAWVPCDRASAAEPREDGPDQDGGRRVGMTSDVVACLAVEGGRLDGALATVHLAWEGQIEEAFLVLSAAGSQGGHSIYVNGQRVGSAPVRPGGRPCRAESAVAIPIPTGALVNGDNAISLSNDANVNDGWTAADLYLEIHGDLHLAPPLLRDISPPQLSSELGATASWIDYVDLNSSYDGEEHRVWYQVPDVYTPTSAFPLLVGMHGWGGTGWDMIYELMGAAVNERGWLFVAPNTHGRYYLDGKRSLAWPGAQHDIVDAIEYMRSNYNVDASRIYIAGPSMGGQATTVMAAKYPDVFAAAAAWSGFTDLADWYNELDDLGKPGLTDSIRWEIDPGCRNQPEPCGAPSEEPFEYQRRSAIMMPQNSRLPPLHMWHNEADILVPVHHSPDLADAINGWNPPIPVTVTTVITYDGDYNHFYPFDDSFDEVFDYLAGFPLSSQPPVSLTIRTDESKPYYWLNFAQTGGDHWSEVEAAYSAADETVTAVVSDTRPLVLAFNLGSTPITGTAGIGRPGMGLPATTYLVNGGGNYVLANYASGYLTTTLSTTGQFTLTISALEAGLSADPGMVSGKQIATSTITAMFEDHLNNPLPVGTVIQFSASEGTFPNARSTYTVPVTAGGPVATILTLTPAADLAEVVASVESVTVSTSVDVLHPAVDVLVTPDRTMVRSGHDVTYTYQVTNSGDITLTGVTLIDDNGTPGDSGDDVTVCADVTLAADAARSYARSATLTEQTTVTATVTGRDPLGDDVTGFGSATVRVISPAIDLLVTYHQTTVDHGELVTYTYQITNTGDITLTGVTVVDDNGTPGDGSDDLTVCGYSTLPPETARSCWHTVTLTRTTTSVATVSGKDLLGDDVTKLDSTTVFVYRNIYLPVITRGY